ncbi:MAG: hypothetical protein JRF25_10205 [Deltaproteobacteria bacterium]|nr:hypothetical protein [Deltaproteobacteria bacterium]
MKLQLGKKPSILRPLMVADQSRQYLLYIPSGYDEQSPAPLVFDFHGSGSTPEQEVAYSDFQRLAEKKGFVLVAPTGLHDNYGRASWNTTMDPRSVDDIGLLKAIIKELTRELAIDKKRIYAAGMSGGARMSSRTACELSDIFAAIAPVAGIQFPDDCAPSRAIPVITFHGKKDLVNHYDHREESRPYWKKGVEDSVAGWVKRNRCKQDPHVEKISEVVTKLTWNECKDGAEVVFYQIEDGGHTWPGSPIVLTSFWSGKTNKDITASELIWKFFEEHPLN